MADDDLVPKLRNLIEGSQDECVPPVRLLARRMHRRLSDVQSALRVLQDQGFVTAGRGRRLTIRGREPQLSRLDVSWKPSSERLFDEVVKRIRAGDFPSGSSLPKIAYYAHQYRMSEHTVRAVYSRLVREGLAHRQGKKTIIGRPAAPSTFRVTERLTVLIISGSTSSWRGIVDSSQSRPFAERFSSEARRFGTRLILASAASTGPGAIPSIAGREAVLREIKRLGALYAGSLLVGKRSEFPDLGEWLDALAVKGKPAVWFDRADEGLGAWRPSRLLTRCFASEEDVAQAAVHALADQGHKQVAYLYDRSQRWHAERGSLIDKVATLAERTLTVRQLIRAEPRDWLEPADIGLDTLLLWLMSNARGELRGALDMFVKDRDELVARVKEPLPRVWRDTPFAGLAAASIAHDLGAPIHEPRHAPTLDLIWSAIMLGPAIRHNGCTAVICPNDLYSRWYVVPAIKRLGIPVPGFFSIVSFDNNPGSQFANLSSVDFGYDYLGYQAFHAILGDVPINRDRDGSIRSKPECVEQGSLDRPRRRSLWPHPVHDRKGI